MKKLLIILLFLLPVLGFSQSGVIALRQIAEIDTTHIVKAEWEAYIDGLSSDSQTLSFANPNLSISGGNSVDISGVNTDDQTLSFSSPNLSITGGNSVDISAVNTDAQTLSFINPNLSITGGNSADISGVNYWTKSTSDIYYNAGKVLVNGTTPVTGGWDFQVVSGTSYFNSFARIDSWLELEDIAGAPASMDDGYGGLFVRNDSILFMDDLENIYSLMGGGASSPWNTDANGINYTAGNVGIGGSSSGIYDLYVTGTGYISSNFTVNGTITTNSGLSMTDNPISNLSYITLNGNNITGFSGGLGLIYVSSSDSLPYYIKENGASDIKYSFDLTSASDFWKKKDFKLIDSPLNKILSLQSYQFNWKKSWPEIAPKDKIIVEIQNDKNKRDATGMIAQEVEKIIPEVVNTFTPDGYKEIDYDALVPYLVEAIKEQQKQIDQLKQEIERLK